MCIRDRIDALSLGLDVLSKMSGFNNNALNVPIEMSTSLNATFANDHTPNEWKEKLTQSKEKRFAGWGEL